MINKGFPDNPIEGDCSWTYSEANGSKHWVINLTYAFVAFLPFVAGVYYIKLSSKIRKKQKRKKLARMTLLDKIFIILLCFSGSSTLMSIDTDGAAGILGMRFYTALVGFAMISASAVMKNLFMDWGEERRCRRHVVSVSYSNNAQLTPNPQSPLWT